MRSWILPVCLLALAPLVLHGQDAPPSLPPPTPPLVINPPEFARWSIRIEDSARPKMNSGDATDGKNQPSPYPVEIQSTRTKNLKVDEVRYSNGKTKETWFVGEKAYFSHPDSEKVGSVAPSFFSDKEAFGPFGNIESSRGFPGVGWINLESYKGAAQVQGVSCYHYQTEANWGGKKVMGEAWIDAKTKLPIALRLNTQTLLFSFHEPPSGMLTPPPAYVAAIREQVLFEQRVKALQQMR